MLKISVKARARHSCASRCARTVNNKSGNVNKSSRFYWEWRRWSLARSEIRMRIMSQFGGQTKLLHTVLACRRRGINQLALGLREAMCYDGIMTRISKYLLTRARCFRTKSDRNPWCAQIAPWWFWQTKDQDRRKIQASHPRRRPRYPRSKWNFFRAEKSWLMALYIISYQHPFVTQKIYCTANILQYVGWNLNRIYFLWDLCWIKEHA